MSLFLEGPRMIGKSTILRKHLLALDYKIGGYCVQRILSSQDEVIGYQLKSTKNLSPLTSSYEIPTNNCFIKQVDGKIIHDLAVFENLGQKLLEDALTGKYDVILLDEIGGIELQVPEFYQLLLKVLAASKKVIGVYKSPDNYKNQMKRSQQSFVVNRQREEIEKLMNNQNRIIVSAKNHKEVNQKVLKYLTSV